MFCRAISLFCFLFSFLIAFSCECPPVGKLTKEQAETYHLIFRGEVVSVTGNTALFSAAAVYKGPAEKSFQVLFDDSTDCRMAFAKGEEWIIYSNYESFG